MRISLLIPCHNEEKTLEKSILSWLDQTRPADEIIVVDDSSTDGTPAILKKFKGKVQMLRTPKNAGSKSYAQEFGLQFVTGDVVITTDGDSILHKDFIHWVGEAFKDPSVAAFGGYVKSLKYNWLTSCRAIDYFVGQNVDKLAQDYINFMFVIPGAVGAFRTDVFKNKVITFDHDTITEDLDFTYKLHKMGMKIKYDSRAICYTQDPSNLKSYVNQMRRWYGGGWQNLLKHIHIPERPGMAMELALIYTEGLIFSFLIFLLPLINITYALILCGMYFIIAFIVATFASIKERRTDLFHVLPGYVFLKYVNAWIYLEQFTKEIILKRKSMVWNKPDRVQI